MFHTYVHAQCGNEVDFDRASFLMDRDLLDASLAATRLERDARPHWDTRSGAQWVWNDYCGRYLEKFGEPFVPNDDPTWDRPEPLPRRDCR